MKVVILCGGYGTRIRDVAADLPKPMINVGPFPILWHIMKGFASGGHREFVLCLGYKGDSIIDFFINYQARTRDLTVVLGRELDLHYHTMHQEDGWEVTLVASGLDSMTGARVRRAVPYLDGEDFFLTYGDGLADVDLGALLDFHRAHDRALTVTGVRPPGRFGEIDEAEGRVTGFNEKPQAGSGLISGGFFVCRPRVLDHIPEGDDVVLEEGPFRSLVEAGEMMVYKHEGFWHPMDTHRDYRYLNELWARRQAPWKRW